jgi:Glycosyl transferase family 11
MVITNLIGGLGNQLFQYAAGFAAAHRAGTELRVSLDMFEDYRLHQGFDLARVFAVDPKPASKADLRAHLGLLSSRTMRRAIGAFAGGFWRARRALFQPTVPYWPGFEKIGPDIYLQGYWQSERYFADAAQELRAALQFRLPPSSVNHGWTDRIRDCISVGVHVRRGDYTSARNSRLYATCTEEYYREAMQFILNREPQAQFFVFSDDPAWARALFSDRAGCVKVLDHNRGQESYNDMRLMSCCRHNIIANSTFSWWGAWLAEQPGQIVVTPKRWLLPRGWDVDMVPSRWVRL